MSGLGGLLKDLEQDCFTNSEQRVLAAFVATKCDPPPVGRRVRRSLPKSTGKPRVICLTAKRRSQKRGFKGTLHVCKLAQGRYQVRKSVRLKLLTRIEAFVDSPGQQEYFELTFAQRGFTSGEVRLAFEVKSAAVRLELLGTLYAFCAAHEKRAPQVAGIDAAELEAAAALLSSRQVAEPAVGQTAKVLLAEVAVRDDGVVAGGEGDDVLHLLWGQREDRQIQSLLEMVSVGAASMEELQERLETELAALEDASVHEILENGGMVGRVLGELGGTLALLDDLEENLNIYDAQLRHMRDDISAIEDRNNQLELHSRNNQKLLGVLEGLVGRLTLQERAERALQAHAINAANLPGVVEAAWELHGHLQALSAQPDSATAAGAAAAGSNGQGEGRVPAAVANMAAVAAQRQRLYGLQRAFVDRAAEYLQQELGRVADAALERVAALQGSQRVRPVDHSSVRRAAGQLAPLLEVVGALRPAAGVAPREAYCRAVNSLLRQEVHAAASELKRMAAAADAGGQHEPDLLDRTAAADTAGTLERLSAMPGSAVRSRGAGTGPSAADLSASYREAGITPIHEGYAALLDSHVPVLAEEARQCVALLFAKPQPHGQQEGGSAGAAAAAAAAAAAGAAKSVRFAGAAEPAPHAAAAGSAEVQGALASLLAGLDGELQGLIDAVKPQRQLLCLPMLGATLAWKQRLGARGAEARPLMALLAQCEQRLTARLAAYFSDRAAAVQRFDGRSSMPSVGSSQAKGQHVLPFIANFPAVAARIEALLEQWPPGAAQQAAAQQEAAAPQQEGTPATARLAAPGTAQRPPLPAGQSARPPPPLAPSPFQTSVGGSSRETPGGWRGAAESAASEVISLPVSSEGVSEISYMQTAEEEEGGRRTTDASGEADSAAARGAAAAPPPAQQPAPMAQQQQAAGPGDVLRELVDAGYAGWLRGMAAAVEAAGATDAKHGVRLRLENYAFWQLVLQSLPLARAPVLQAFAAHVAALRDGAMAGYIEQQVDYFKFTRILEFSRKLDEAVAAVGADEVRLQQQFQPGEVRQLLVVTTSGLDKKLVQVYQRVQKHLGGSSPYLVEPVWEKLEGICLERWARMEHQVAACYGGMELRPPAAELRRWFHAARQGR